MKNIAKIVLNCLLILILISCEKKEDESINPELVGVYSVVSVETTPKLDLNQDGIFSENFLDEMDCYDNDKVILEKDGVYSTVQGHVSVDIDFPNGNDPEYTIRCDRGLSVNLPATYRTRGNKVIVTVQDFEPLEFEFEVINNTIVLERSIPEIAFLNENGGLDFIQVDATYTYRK